MPVEMRGRTVALLQGFLRSFCGCFVLVAVLGAAFGTSARAAEKPPNILLLVTDDQRFDLMGNVTPLLHTPQMDRLVQEGVRFDNAFVTTSICAASRASILSGLVERTHQFTFGTPNFRKELVDVTFPALLRKAGYRTGYVGKLGVYFDPGDVEKLYDSFVKLGRSPYWKKQPDGSMKHVTDLEGEAAMAFLDQHAASNEGKPFALTVGFNAPHADDAYPEQYFWQKEVDHLYQDVEIPDPPLSDGNFYDQTHPYLRDGTMNRERWHWRFSGPKRKDMVKGYFRMISGVDLVIGRIRDHLRKLKLDRDTVIIMIGDNGYFLGERGYAGKWLPYEPSLRVPLVIHDPRGKAARRGLKVKPVALNIDVAPTILDLAGAKVPAVMQGRSLLALTRGQKPARWRTDNWFEHLMMNDSIRKHEGVRTDRYKYIRYFEASPVLEELYDLRADPLETINLVRSPRHSKTLHLLRRRTDELRDGYGGPFPLSTLKSPLEMRPTQ